MEVLTGAGRHAAYGAEAGDGADHGRGVLGVLGAEVEPMPAVVRWSGRESGALRAALRMTVREFAEYLGVSPRTVAAWEAGGEGRFPRPVWQAALDTALDRADPPTRERFTAATSTGIPNAGQHVIATGVDGGCVDGGCVDGGGVSAGQEVVPAGIAMVAEAAGLTSFGPVGGRVVAEVARCTDAGVERIEAVTALYRSVDHERGGGVGHAPGPGRFARNRMDAASVVVSVEELEMVAEQSSRFVRRAGVAVSPEVVEQLDADLEWLAREYLRRPPYALFRILAGVRTDVFALIDARPDPRHLTDLYRIAGRLTALLAHASSDLGHPHAVDSHARSALLCAQYAGDADLAAYVRWVQSITAHWRGDYTAAGDLAGAGLAVAHGGHDVLRLSSQQARAHAAAGRHGDCERSLAQALDARDAVIGAPGPVGVFAFPAGKAAYYSSEIRLALGGRGNVSRAVAEATEALALLDGDPATQHCAELHAASRLDLVGAYLALGDLDGAAEHARTALTLPAESRTVAIMGRIMGAHQGFGDARYTGNAVARDLREQIEVFTAYPAARELPAELD